MVRYDPSQIADLRNRGMLYKDRTRTNERKA